MKKISKEQLSDLELFTTGRKSAVRVAIESMEVGEILQIEKKDWHQKKPPSYLCRMLERKQKKKFTLTKYTGGFVIQRFR